MLRPRGHSDLSSARARPAGVLPGTGRLLRAPAGAGSVQPQGDAARGCRRGPSSPRATPQGVADGDRPAPGIATGARARCSTGRTREVRAPSQRQHHRVRGVRSDARGIGSARPGRALGSGGDRGSVRRPGDRAPAARTSRDRLDRHRYDFHARQATRTKQPPDPVLVGLSLLGLVEPTSLTLNLRMRTEGHAPWGRWERPAVHFGPLSTERQA